MRNKHEVMFTVLLSVFVMLSPFTMAQDDDPYAPFLGIWSSVLTTQDNEYWYLEDFMCFAGCAEVAYKYMTELMEKPENEDVPPRQMMGKGYAYQQQYLGTILTPLGKAIQKANNESNDAKLLCQPYGLLRQAPNPLGLQIRRNGEHLLVQYEEWSMLRTLYLDGREHPEHLIPRLLGHSTATLEDGALIVDSTLLTPDWITDFGHVGHTDQARVTERYTVHDDPRRLKLRLTVADPQVLTEPFVITKTWLSTPDVELETDRCSAIPGTF